MINKGYDQNSHNLKDPYAQIIGLQNVFVLPTVSEANLVSVKKIAREEMQATTHAMMGTPVGGPYWTTQAKQQLAKAKEEAT